MSRFLTARRHFWTPWFRTNSLYGKRTVVFFSLASHVLRACEARARLLRHALPISLLILREKRTNDCVVVWFKNRGLHRGNSKMACFIPKIHYLLGNTSSPWDMVTYFQTNKTLEINGNLPSREVRKLLFSVVRREQWDNMLLGFSPLQYSALFALRQSHLDFITFKAID